MKIVVAGFSKTGTKSVHSALKTLGFKVYDHLEHFLYLEKEWNKILDTGGKIQDFRHMYEDVDVGIDSPVYYFWKEIHTAFPNSMIILLTRNEEEWIESFSKQFTAQNGMKLLNLARCLSPTGRRYFRFARNSRVVLFGHYEKYFWHNTCNKMVLKRKFRQHNADVMMNAPPDKLLIFSVKEGWEPLCKFLGKPVPSKPFPHENIRSSIFSQWSSQHPVIKQMIKETWIAISMLVSFTVVIIAILFHTFIF